MLLCLQGENEKKIFNMLYNSKLLMYWWVTYSEQVRWDKWWKKKNKFFERKIIYSIDYTLENPLDSKELKPVSPKGNQPWMFIRSIDAELKLQYFGHLMRRANLLKDPDAG